MKTTLSREIIVVKIAKKIKKIQFIIYITKKITKQDFVLTKIIKTRIKTKTKKKLKSMRFANSKYSRRKYRHVNEKSLTIIRVFRCRKTKRICDYYCFCYKLQSQKNKKYICACRIRDTREINRLNKFYKFKRLC